MLAPLAAGEDEDMATADTMLPFVPRTRIFLCLRVLLSLKNSPSHSLNRHKTTYAHKKTPFVIALTTRGTTFTPPPPSHIKKNPRSTQEDIDALLTLCCMPFTSSFVCEDTPQKKKVNSKTVFFPFLPCVIGRRQKMWRKKRRRAL